LTDRSQVWSCGGGTQSSAIAALIIQGKLPKPDHSVIVDTERELSSTWTYMDEVLAPELAKVGVNLVRVCKSRYATVDLYRDDKILIPAYTRQEGRVGRFKTYCSNEWKERVVMRYLRDQGVEQCDCWMGITTDEMRRASNSKTLWFQKYYPLINEIPMDRQACIDLVKEMGWPEPPRSSCWMCPNRAPKEWAEMKENNYPDFLKAASFEERIQMKDDSLYLTKAAVPLNEIEWSDQEKAAKEHPALDFGCSSGHCFT